MITQHAAQRLRERCAIDPRKLEALLKERGLCLPQGCTEVPGYGTLIVEGRRLVTMLDEEMTSVRRKQCVA